MKLWWKAQELRAKKNGRNRRQLQQSEHLVLITEINWFVVLSASLVAG